FLPGRPTTPETPTLSLHDALPILWEARGEGRRPEAARERQGEGPEGFSDRRQADQTARLAGQGQRQGGVRPRRATAGDVGRGGRDRKSTRLNSSHVKISYAVFCLK